MSYHVKSQNLGGNEWVVDITVVMHDTPRLWVYNLNAKDQREAEGFALGKLKADLLSLANILP